MFLEGSMGQWGIFAGPPKSSSLQFVDLIYKVCGRQNQSKEAGEHEWPGFNFQ